LIVLLYVWLWRRWELGNREIMSWAIPLSTKIKKFLK